MWIDFGENWLIWLSIQEICFWFSQNSPHTTWNETKPCQCRDKVTPWLGSPHLGLLQAMLIFSGGSCSGGSCLPIWMQVADRHQDWLWLRSVAQLFVVLCHGCFFLVRKMHGRMKTSRTFAAKSRVITTNRAKQPQHFLEKLQSAKQNHHQNTQLLLWHSALQRTSMFWRRASHQERWGEGSNNLAAESACFVLLPTFYDDSLTFSTLIVSTTWIARVTNTKLDPATVAHPSTSKRRKWKLLHWWVQKRARITLEVRFSM